MTYCAPSSKSQTKQMRSQFFPIRSRVGQAIFRFGLALLLAFLIAIAISPLTASFTLAQTPFFPATRNSSPTTNSQWWDPNKAYLCGRLWCSDVHLIGSLGDHFTVAMAPKLKEAPSSFSPEIQIQQRAKLVQQTYEAIIKKIITSDSYAQLIRQPEIAKIAGSPLKKQGDKFSFLLQPKSLFPLTPSIEIGYENGQTVIYAVGNSDLGIASQSLVTVNEDDSLFNGQPIPQVAEKWRDIMREGFSEALWGKTLDRLFPLKRYKYASAIIGIFFALILSLALISYLLGKLENRIWREQRDLKQSLTENQSPSSSENPQQEKITPPLHQKWSRFVYRLRTDSAHLIPTAEIFNQLGNLVENLPKTLLKRQLWLEQVRSLLQLLLRLLFWGQVWLFLSGLAITVLIFPEMRRYSYFFWGQATTLPLLWMGVTMVDKLCDLVIDYWLHHWAEKAYRDDPTSNRYTLRISTYSPALKGATTFIFTALGIYWTLLLYVKDPAVLAGAGGLAVIVAFLSRNLLEDMLNGALILFTDRYAIGDVIAVDRFSGLVENMNLYMTQIRGAEGRLITLPNGKISIVENLTKDWSRVDFEITLATDNDPEQAFQLIEQVAKDLQAQPHWQDKILEPAIILGMDELSHAGMVIKVWIKTLPNQQWTVGREFRRRIKQAFEQTGITLGIPQQAIHYNLEQNAEKGNYDSVRTNISQNNLNIDDKDNKS